MNGNVRKTCVSFSVSPFLSFLVYCLVFSVSVSCFCVCKASSFILTSVSFIFFSLFLTMFFECFSLIPCVSCHFLSFSLIINECLLRSLSSTVFFCLTLLNFCPVPFSCRFCLFSPYFSCPHVTSRHCMSMTVNVLCFQDFRFVLRKERKTVNSCSLMSVLTSKLFVLKALFALTSETSLLSLPLEITSDVRSEDGKEEPIETLLLSFFWHEVQCQRKRERERERCFWDTRQKEVSAVKKPNRKD